VYDVIVAPPFPLEVHATAIDEDVVLIRVGALGALGVVGLVVVLDVDEAVLVPMEFVAVI
jgi:hypothetical protein